MSKYDNDGLLRKYGTEKAVPTVGGEYRSVGPLRELEIKLDLTTLATGSQTILADTTFFPKMRIEQVIIEVQTAVTSGGAATLDVGLVATDRTTEIDFDGFIAAQPKAGIDTAGKKITFINGTASAGALIGTTTSSVGYIVAKAGTAVFTAGVCYVRVYFRPN